MFPVGAMRADLVANIVNGEHGGAPKADSLAFREGLMSKIVCVAFAAALLSTPSLAQDATAPAAAVATTPASNSGKVVMFRPATVLGAAVACPIRFNGREVVELARGKFAEWAVPAGAIRSRITPPTSL